MSPPRSRVIDGVAEPARPSPEPAEDTFLEDPDGSNALVGDTRSLEETRKQEENAMTALGARLENRFQREPQDPGWSAPTLREAWSVLAAETPTGRVVDGSCRSTLCRIVVEHADQADRKEFAGAIAAKPPFTHGVVYVRGSGNKGLVTTLYVAREGHNFDE